MGTKSIIKELKGFKANLEKDFPIEKIIFFGSRAKGHPKKDSDIDLIIVSPKFKKYNFIERSSKMYDYWELNYPVDFMCFTSEEYNERKNMVSIVSEAERDGIEV